MNIIFIHVCNSLQRSNLVISTSITINTYHFFLEGGFTDPPPPRVAVSTYRIYCYSFSLPHGARELQNVLLLSD